MNSELMYQEIILDYYRNPKNKGVIEQPHVSCRDSNPLCGDIIEVHLALDSQGIITSARFNGNGCVISQAATSMLLEHIAGKKIGEIPNVKKEHVLELLSVPISFVRLKCALLGLKVLKQGAYTYLGGVGEDVK